MRKSPTTPPATIPLQYDYQPRMSPSSSVAANIYDNQYTSLFGDPVPPPTDDFLENLDSHLYGSLRRSSIVQDFPKYNSFSTAGRTGTPSPPVRIIPGSPRTRARQGESGASGEMQPSRNYLTPEIRILPGSGSSSERLYPPSTLGGNREGRSDARRQVDVDSDNIYNGSSVDYNWNVGRRRSSDFSEDFQGNLENVRTQPNYENRQTRMFSHEPLRVRQSSNESYSSTDWFKPSNDFQEWSRIPRLRPSSKNVMSINQAQQHKESPVATLINDSNASSSSDDKVLSPEMRAFEITTQIRPKTTTLKRVQEPSSSLDEPPQPIGLPPSGVSSKRDVSPVIMTNAITTGSDYRITTPRPHKKSSFTIIAEKSPQSSRAQSPSQAASGRASPFLGRGFKEPPQRPSSQPLSTPSVTSRLRLPVIGNSSALTTSDDSPRPSVQFNVQSSVSSRASPTKATSSKGILHNKSGLPQPTSRILNQGQKVRSFEALPRISSGPVSSSARPPVRRLNKSSLDLYGNKQQPPEPPKPRFNVNPTSQHRGLLRVISTSADNSPSRIPVRAGNNLGSMDDIVLSRRASLSPIRRDHRRGSTSPERRSSSQTDPRSSITSDRRTSNLSSYSTSDYSFRRGSNSPLRNSGGRRQSIFQSGSSNLRKSSSGPNLQLSHLRGIRNSSRSPRKVAKPTTLSPIIGTPNREGPSSSEDVESSMRSGMKNETNGTKIPVREGSNLPSRSSSKVGSRANSRAPSAVNSRSNSPTKGSNTLSQSNSRVTSRDSSRATSRAGSRVQSRSNSRSTTRVGPTITTTRSSTRANNSSPPKNRRASPPKSRSSSPKKTRRKSESPSKSPDRSKNIGRGRSRTDVRRGSPKRTSPPKSTVSRKDSPKRASVRKEPASAKKTSSNIKKPESSVKRTPSSVRKETSLKRETSTLRRSTSNLKKETPLKREPSSLRRAPSNLKREPSNLTKGASGLKRESSNVKKEPSGLKREPSNLRRTPSNVSSKLKREPSNSKLKREPSNLKTRTDSNLSLGKKLEKKGSFKNEKKNPDDISEDAATITTTSTTESQTQDEAGDGKLVALTRANVVSMTTAAITSQPLHITTTLTNQIALKKTDSSGQLTSNSGDKSEDGNLPATILEKSQKTLENIQKTVTEATDEIHKTINENLTDLKSLESDMGKMSADSLPAPFEKSESLKTIIENPAAENKSGNSKSGGGGGVNQATKSPAPPSQPIEADVSVLNTKKPSENLLSPGSNHNNNNNNNNTGNGSDPGKNHEDMEERVSERAISVLPEVECESANLQSYEHDGHHPKDGSHARGKDGAKNDKSHEEISGAAGDGGDGKAGNIEDSGSQEYLDGEKPTGCCGKSRCCKCCSRLCMPFRRCQCCRCCRKEGDLEKAVISEVDEKASCWKRMKCCNRKSKEDKAEKKTMETISEEPGSDDAPKQGKCRLCLNKFFCCRATNKVEATRSEGDEVTKCCFCIPCRKKKKASTAWRERSESIVSVPPAGGRCGRIIEKLKCWKKKPPVSESRRASTVSKKQSIAPTIPPEDTRSKLHVDLVEYNSKMKGAIPVLPLPLAWFCMICNVIVPGLGTLFSGFFCVCVGIPRFSQYDSAKARFGSFIINCIVAVSQLFCVLFCCVGWGWSIWWGTIMLKTARKLKKIKRVERLEMEEEERQAAANRDVEAGKT